MNYFLVIIAPEIDLCLAIATNSAQGRDLTEIANELGREFAVQTNPVPPGAPVTSPAESKPSAADRLKELKELFEKGLISQEVYDQKRKEILDSL